MPDQQPEKKITLSQHSQIENVLCKLAVEPHASAALLKEIRQALVAEFIELDAVTAS